MKLFTVLLLFLVCFQVQSEDQVFRTKNGFRKISKKTERQDWWNQAVFYQIYPRSFKDSNNDGTGDLQGIISKLDHLVDAGVTATWLSPIFKSPQVDQGYDISDYRDVDPLFGTLSDLRKLVDKIHELGLKIILDFVPNHTSDQHEWFQKSIKRVSGFEDFYIWNNGSVDGQGNRVPPNNWISAFRGPAWTWNEDRQQFYYHMFASAQPDLNYRNPAVVKAMKDVLTYWLDFGADGFRVDAINCLFEDANLLDEPKSGTSDDPTDPGSLLHVYTNDQNETFDMVYDWRDHLDNYTNTHNVSTKIFMTEAYSNFDNTMRYFGLEDNNGLQRLGAHFSFNFAFITSINENVVPEDIIQIVSEWIVQPYWVTNNWVLGNHDNHRVANRLGVDNIDGFNMLASLLPGVQVTYNGEEIGQENGEVTCEQGQDPSAIKNCSTFDQISRDFERTPYQWDSSVNAGFNDGAKPWLPVSKKAKETNLKLQNVKGQNTHYNIYKSLIGLRQELQGFYSNSSIIIFDIGEASDKVLFLSWQYTDFNLNGSASFVFIFNLGDKSTVVKELPELKGDFKVQVRSVNSDYKIGDLIDMKQVALKPHESIIVKALLL